MAVAVKNKAKQRIRLKPWVRPPKPDPLPLENGARLSRAEFERRYEAMPQVKKAELIEGVVYMPSPVHVEHSRAHSQVIIWLGAYHIATPDTEVDDNVTVRLGADTEVQPDALLRLKSSAGGASYINRDHYIEGAPELVVEIAASSASYDLHDKKNVYRRNGVKEYIVWQVYDEALKWFQLQGGEYRLIEPDEAGVIGSRAFPGLRLDVESLLAGDLSAVLAAVKVGTETEEHAAFIEGLATGP